MSHQPQSQSEPSGEIPLQGWKEIGAHLERDESTARRWERDAGLPVRRHLGDRRSSVYAFKSEIDAWRASRAPAPNADHIEQPRRRLIPALAMAGAVVAALLVIRFGPVLSPPSPIAEAAQDGVRTELVWPQAKGISPQGSVSSDGSSPQRKARLTG